MRKLNGSNAFSEVMKGIHKRTYQYSQTRQIQAFMAERWKQLLISACSSIAVVSFFGFDSCCCCCCSCCRRCYCSSPFSILRRFDDTLLLFVKRALFYSSSLCILLHFSFWFFLCVWLKSTWVIHFHLGTFLVSKYTYVYVGFFLFFSLIL